MSHQLHMTHNQNSLSKYEIVRPIGRGAGSFVYKIKDRKTGKFSALKVIEKRHEKFRKIKARITNEIEVHSKLDQENIVKLLSHFEDQDNCYILLELCEGGELYSKTKSTGRLNEEEVRRYGSQFAKGLKYLHDNKILHRDLKLSNLLLTDKDVIKICDFGLSVRLKDLEPECDTLCGTPNYLSPEVVNQEPYGIKADCWAFGCIVYAMATGSPPFEGESIKETLLNVKRGEFKLPDYLSNDLRDLLKNLLDWSPETRIDINTALAHPFFTSHTTQKSKAVKLVKLETHSTVKTQNPTCVRRYSEVPNKPQYEIKNQIITPVEKQKLINHIKCCSTVTPLQAKVTQILYPSSAVTKSFLYGSSGQGKENIPTNRDTSNQSIKHDESAAIIKPIKSSHHSRNPLAPIRSSGLSRLLTPGIVRDESRRSDSRLRNNGDNFLFQKKMFGVRNQESSLQNVDYSVNTSITLNTTSQTQISPNRGSKDFLSFMTEGDAPHYSEKKLQPLNTFGIRSYKFNMKNGFIEVDEDGLLTIKLLKSSKEIMINQDGSKIFVRRCSPIVEERQYEVDSLPLKYHKFYEYASKVCDVIRTKIPKVKIDDEEGSFSLMQNSPFPNFEGKFRNGVKVRHTLSSEIIRIDLNDGSVCEINIQGNNSYLGGFINSIVKRTFEKINLCLEKDNER